MAQTQAQPITHVSIPPPSARRRWWRQALPLGIAVGTVIVLGIAGRSALRSAVDVDVVPVLIEAAEVSVDPQATSGPPVQAAGWIEAEPYSVTVSALAEGVVREVLALEGAVVNEGDVMARLIDDDARLALRRREAEVAMRRADVAAAEAHHQSALANVENPVELERDVAVARSAAASASAAIAAADADVKEQVALHAELEDEYRRNVTLREQNIIAEATLLRMKLRLDAQAAAVESAKSKVDVAKKEAARAAAEVDAAERHLHLQVALKQEVGVSRAAVEGAKAALLEAEAAMEDAALRLDRMTLRAPMSGVVLARFVEPGRHLSSDAAEPHSMAAFRLYDPSRLQARVDVPLAEAGRVSVGQSATVETEAAPGRTFRAEVVRIVHEANLQRNTVQFKLHLLETDPVLKPDMLVRVRIGGSSTPSTGDAATERLFVPVAALDGVDGSSAAVWAVDATHDTASRRAVTLGESRGEAWVEVVSGLRAGDRIIVSDRSGLSDGDRIRVAGVPQEENHDAD